MLQTEIKVYPNSGGGFTVVHIDPFAKRRIRQKFEARQDAEAHKKALTEKFEQKIKDNPDEMLLSDLMFAFLKEHPKNGFSSAKKLFVDFCDTFGHLRIKDVTTEALRAWLSQLQIENDYKESTMFGHRTNVNIFLKYLIRKRVIAESPILAIHYSHRGAETRKVRVILSEEEIQQFAAAAKIYSPGYFYPIFLMFVETGAKTDEIINLTWKAVDFKKRTVTFPSGESLKSRTLPLSKELAECLSKKRPLADVVFTNLYDRKFRKKQLTIALFDFQSSLGIKKKWRYFDIRHSIAHNFLAAGGEIRKLQVMLGHSSYNVTQDMYGAYRVKRVEISSPFEG